MEEKIQEKIASLEAIVANLEQLRAKESRDEKEEQTLKHLQSREEAYRTWLNRYQTYQAIHRDLQELSSLEAGEEDSVRPWGLDFSAQEQERLDELRPQKQRLEQALNQIETEILDNTGYRLMQKELITVFVANFFPENTCDSFTLDGYQRPSTSDSPSVKQLKLMMDILYDLHLLFENPHSGYLTKIKSGLQLRDNLKASINAIDLSFIDHFLSTAELTTNATTEGDTTSTNDAMQTEPSIRERLIFIFGQLKSAGNIISIDQAELLIQEFHRAHLVLSVQSGDLLPEDQGSSEMKAKPEADTQRDQEPSHIVEQPSQNIIETAEDTPDTMTKNSPENPEREETAEEKSKRLAGYKRKRQLARRVLNYAMDRVAIKNAHNLDSAPVIALNKAFSLADNYLETYDATSGVGRLISLYKIFYQEHRNLNNLIARHDSDSLLKIVQQGDRHILSSINQQIKLLRTLHCGLAQAEVNFGFIPGKLTKILHPMASYIESLAEFSGITVSEDDQYNYHNATYHHLLRDWQKLNAHHQANTEKLNNIYGVKKMLFEFESAPDQVLDNPENEAKLLHSIDVLMKPQLTTIEIRIHYFEGRMDVLEKEILNLTHQLTSNLHPSIHQEIREDIEKLSIQLKDTSDQLNLAQEKQSNLFKEKQRYHEQIRTIFSIKQQQDIEPDSMMKTVKNIAGLTSLFFVSLLPINDVQASKATNQTGLTLSVLLTKLEQITQKQFDEANQNFLDTQRQMEHYHYTFDTAYFEGYYLPLIQKEEQLAQEADQHYQMEKRKPESDQNQKALDSYQKQIKKHLHKAEQLQQKMARMKDQLQPDESLDSKEINRSHQIPNNYVRSQMDIGKSYLQNIRQTLLVNVHHRFIESVTTDLPVVGNQRQKCQVKDQDLQSIKAIKGLLNVFSHCETLLDELYVPAEREIDDSIQYVLIDPRPIWNAMANGVEDLSHGKRVYQTAMALHSELSALQSAYQPEYISSLLSELGLSQASLDQVQAHLKQYGIDIPLSSSALSMQEYYQTALQLIHPAKEVLKQAVAEYRKLAMVDENATDNDLIKSAMHRARENLNQYRLDSRIDARTIAMLDKLVTFGEMFQEHGHSESHLKQIWSALTAIKAWKPSKRDINEIVAARQEHAEMHPIEQEELTPDAHPDTNANARLTLQTAATLLKDENLVFALHTAYAYLPTAYRLAYRFSVENGLAFNQIVGPIAEIDRFVRNIAQIYDLELGNLYDDQIHSAQQHLDELAMLDAAPNRSPEDEIRYQQLQEKKALYKQVIQAPRPDHAYRAFPEVIRLNQLREIRNDYQALQRLESLKERTEQQEHQYQMLKPRELELRQKVEETQSEYTTLLNAKSTPEQIQIAAYDDRLYQQLPKQLHETEAALSATQKNLSNLLGHDMVIFYDGDVEMLDIGVEKRNDIAQCVLEEKKLIQHQHYLHNAIEQMTQRREDFLEHVLEMTIQHARAHAEHDARRVLQTELEYAQFALYHAQLEYERLYDPEKITTPGAKIKAKIWLALRRELSNHRAAIEEKLNNPLSDQDILSLNNQTELKTREIIDTWATTPINALPDIHEKPKLVSLTVKNIIHFISDLFWFYCLRPIQLKHNTNRDYLTTHRNPLSFFTSAATRSAEKLNKISELTPFSLLEAESGQRDLNTTPPPKPKTGEL